MRVLVSLVLLVSLPAGADDIDVRVDSRAELGRKPALTIVVNKDIERVVVSLDGNGQRYRRSQGPQSAPGELRFELPHGTPGLVQWKGSLEVRFVDGASGTMPLAFSTEVLSANFTFAFGPHDLDLEADTLLLRSERATTKVEVEVYGDEDELLASSAQDYEPAIPAGQPVPVSWIKNKKADVLRLRLTVHDDRGSFRSSDSFPYTITIPHEDVVFDTGKSTLRPDQEPKLTATLPEIARAVKRFGPAMKAAGATVRLFVSGHTDTVGPATANQALSHARAEAIASWFVRHGVPVAVYARGFGESALKVSTADETEHEENRRVDYDIGVNGPTGSLAGWTKVGR